MRNLPKKHKKTKKMIGSKKLGTGIYTIPDIHLILGYPLYKIRRYIRKYWDNLGMFLYKDTYSWIDGKRKVVPFLVLIELYTFFEMLEKGAKTKAIAKTRKEMAIEFKTPYPFAYRDYLVERNTISYYAGNLLITADKKQQTSFVNMIEKFGKKVKFKENLAYQFFPLANSENILVDPRHQFGQPVINKTNIPTETIYLMHKAGEEKKALSVLYNISEQQIKDVIRFHEYSKAA
ncbi:MAG: DUF433 domain-containing protein [Chlorobi bacterium]|nr:DUF433 domain-containing protein [Chlorobiota bacterium]MCI0717126.1 DUF433 domain-containing protein [Chlorobiota bacterium]